MDNVLLKFVRHSDNQSFYIGNSTLWRLLKGGLENFSAADNIVNYTNNATMDGGYVDSTYVPVIDRNVSCAYVMPMQNLTARKEALNFFSVKQSYRLFVYYDTTIVWADCYITRMSLSISTRFKDRLDLSLALRFANPYWNSYDSHGEDISRNRPMMAFPYLCTMDEDYPGPKGFTGGIISTDTSINFINDGDVETYGVVTLKATGSVINPCININDHYVKLIDTLSMSDVVVMDFTKLPPTVTKNGVNCIGKCDRTSEFDSMALKVGSNFFEYTADDGLSHLSVSLTYNNKYEAI